MVYVIFRVLQSQVSLIRIKAFCTGGLIALHPMPPFQGSFDEEGFSGGYFTFILYQHLRGYKFRSLPGWIKVTMAIISRLKSNLGLIRLLMSAFILLFLMAEMRIIIIYKYKIKLYLFCHVKNLTPCLGISDTSRYLEICKLFWEQIICWFCSLLLSIPSSQLFCYNILQNSKNFPVNIQPWQALWFCMTLSNPHSFSPLFSVPFYILTSQQQRWMENWIPN